MRNHFQKTFEQVTMPEGCARRIQADILSKTHQQEVLLMKPKKRLICTLAAVVAVVLSLSLTAFAANEATDGALLRQFTIWVNGEEYTASLTEDGDYTLETDDYTITGNYDDGSIDIAASGSDLEEEETVIVQYYVPVEEDEADGDASTSAAGAFETVEEGDSSAP
ncbi:MAG: hypothetical protein LUD78_12190 [Clostridiales bacterium]|nr:hypothetical protein [Clostridiales bacterium]